MDLLALSDFIAVASHGGFAPASRAVGRPEASLSRRVRALEAELGVRLIERGTRSLRLTEAGAALHAQAAGSIERIEAIGTDLAASGPVPRGRLRISVPAMMATLPGLGRIAARFVADHPLVRLEIVAEDRFVDPVANDYDLVVRANPTADTHLVGHLLRRDTFCVAAAADRPMPAPPPGLDAVPITVAAVVQCAAPANDVWRIETASGVLALAPMPVLYASSMAIVHEAVLAGAGARIFPKGRIAVDLASGRLRAWGDVKERLVEVWALHPSRRLVAPSVRLFLDALRDLFA